MLDKQVSGCASQSGKTPQTYVAQAFDLRQIRLRTGERMTVAAASDSCMTLGQSIRMMIFERSAGGEYRRVLDTVTLPDTARVNANGTVTVATHDSIEVIFEAAYVWNGSNYVFSPAQSHRYDVALSERRPFERPVHFARGTGATTLAGTVAYNFGDDYVFDARAGQRIRIARLEGSGRARISLYYNGEISSLADLTDANQWGGKLVKTGTYHLYVTGTDEHDEALRSNYEIRLEIH
jgi:hypothetical protein